MNKTYLRGEMYYADLGRGIGSEQEGRRPVLILQNNTGNKYSPTVIVAAISSKVDAKAKLPTHYLLKAENGLELPSLVLLEQLRTIDKKRLETYIGRLEEKHIRRINHALAVSVGLIEEVPENLIMCLCPALSLIHIWRAGGGGSSLYAPQGGVQIPDQALPGPPHRGQWRDGSPQNGARTEPH